MDIIKVKPNKEGKLIIKMFGKEYEIVVEKEPPKVEEKTHK